MIILKYYNAKLQIGLADWKTVYQFPQAEKISWAVVELVMLLAGDKAAALTGLRGGLRKGRNTDKKLYGSLKIKI